MIGSVATIRGIREQQALQGVVSLALQKQAKKGSDAKMKMDVPVSQRFMPLTSAGLEGWRMAGCGKFTIANGVLESHGGPGILWYASTLVDDFILRCAWRTSRREDNSGIYLRIPPLADDIEPAIDEGFEVQIDDRGYNPHTGCEDNPVHSSGAIYGLAPALLAASHPPGSWNEFEIIAQGRVIAVRLNGREVCRCDVAMRRTRGHIGLQTHNEGSRVQFRDLWLRALPS